MKTIAESKVESRGSRKHGRGDGLVRLSKAAPKGANRAGASESIENRAALRGLGASFPQPSTFDLRLSTPISGFSLVEVVIAMGIAAFCLVAIFGLIPAGLKTNKESVAETTAAGLAGRIAADLRSTPSLSSASPLYGLNVSPAAGVAPMIQTVFLKDDGSTNAVTAMGVNYRATVVVSNPNTAGKTPPGRLADVARILISWPAVADPNPTLPPTNFTGSFGTVIGLDRN